MGVSASKEEKPEVDILPPLFQPAPEKTVRLTQSPFEFMFGRDETDKLFNYAVAPKPSGVAVEASVRPEAAMDLPKASLVQVEVAVNPAAATTAGVKFQTGSNPTTQHTGVSGRGSFSHTGMASLMGVAWSPHGAAWAALADPPQHITRLSPGSGWTVPTPDTGGDPTMEDGPLPRARQGTPAGIAGFPPLVGGMRFILPSANTMVGASAWAVPGVPASLWQLTAVDVNTVLGAQITLPLQRLGEAALQGTLSGKTAAGSSVKVGLTTGERPTYLFNLEADVPLASPEAGSVTARYVHTMTTRRKVWNPAEQDHVKGIWNYVDFGVEATRALSAPFKTDITAGASWQANRSLLVKAAAGSTRGFDATVAFRTWGDPVLTMSATGSLVPSSGTRGLMSDLQPSIGLRFSVEKGGKARYSQPVRGYQTNATYQHFEATPALSDKFEAGPVRGVEQLYVDPASGATR